MEITPQVEALRTAINTEDLGQVQALLSRDPELHRAPLGYANNGPLTWVAECRVPGGPPSPTRLEMARWMLDHGSDVHQGGDGPLMRAALGDARIPMMELLYECGADVNALWNGNYPILFAPCETLQPGALRWLLAHGADPQAISPKYGDPLSMLVGTYCRDAAGRHGCLAALAEHGLGLPDTPVMALHQGRLDLLARWLERDPGLLSRHFSETEIYAPEVCGEGNVGLTAVPVAGGTLLHLAVEYADVRTAAWLLEQGADPNARAAPDASGFSNHTPLFHAVITMGAKNDALTRLLLSHGADPLLRATLRKQLRDMGDPAKEGMHEFRDVTPVEFARLFQEPRWIVGPALSLLEAPH